MDELVRGVDACVLADIQVVQLQLGCGLVLVGLEWVADGQWAVGPRLVRYRDKFIPDADYTQTKPV